MTEKVKALHDVEIEKIRAEISKLMAETSKINKETIWYPIAVSASLVAAVAGITAIIIKFI